MKIKKHSMIISKF